MSDKQDTIIADLASVKTMLGGIDKRLEKVETGLEDVKSTVNRWKGAIALLGVLGVAVYYVSGIWAKFISSFKA